jgi:hypothetical protein
MFGDFAKSETFLNLKEVKPEVKSERELDDTFYYLYFSMNRTGVTQERRVNGILDMIGAIGGLSDALVLLFGFLISIVIGSKNHYIHAVQKIFSVSKAEYQAKFKINNFFNMEMTLYEKFLKKISTPNYKQLKKEDAIALI